MAHILGHGRSQIPLLLETGDDHDGPIIRYGVINAVVDGLDLQGRGLCSGRADSAGGWGVGIWASAWSIHPESQRVRRLSRARAGAARSTGPVSCPLPTALIPRAW